MSMTKEKMIEAISRFQCVIAGGDYPQFNDMCLVEIGQNEGKENKESAELFFYSRNGTDGPGLEDWIRRASSPDRASNPATNVTFGTEPVIRPAKQLFALMLASVETLGYLEALKEQDISFQIFATTLGSGYQEALDAGKKILRDLRGAPGNTLQAKLVALNLAEIKGTPGEMQFLTQKACFNAPDLQRLIGLEPVDASNPQATVLSTADILRVNIPVCLPSLDEQRYWKERVIAEVLALDYVGLGYPIGRRLENRHEQRAMYFIQKIYDPKIVLELLGTLLSHATLKRNVSCMTVELVSKIVTTQFEANRDKTLIYDAINHIRPIMRNIPLWSKTNEDSLRPYVQVLEQLFSCIPDDHESLSQFFLELHQFKSEMLDKHGDNLSIKLKGFVDYCETMLKHIYHKKILKLPTPQIMNIVEKLRAIPTHRLDDIGNTRIAELRIKALQVSQGQGQLATPAGTPPAPALRLSQSAQHVEDAQRFRRETEEKQKAERAAIEREREAARRMAVRPMPGRPMPVRQLSAAAALQRAANLEIAAKLAKRF